MDRTHKNRVWRAWYETKKTDPNFIARRRAYHRQRRQMPAVALRLKEHARKHRERHRVAWLALHAVTRCKRTGMEFDREFLREVGKQKPLNCPCCGIRINYRVSGTTKHPIPDGPSLDRVDTTRGYVRGNVEVICWRCNALKRDSTLSELKAIVAYMEARL